METPFQGPVSIDLVPGAALGKADRIEQLAETFSALADPTRLRIVHLLMTQGEMCVCEFMPALNITQSNVSFHLKTLKYAGLITSRKEGRWILYRLQREAFERFRAEFVSIFDPTLWPQEAVPCADVVRRRLACMQEQNPPSHRTGAEEKGNDNANE